jgi:hypothetical protein
VSFLLSAAGCVKHFNPEAYGRNKVVRKMITLDGIYYVL